MLDIYISQYKASVVNFVSTLRMSGVSKYDSRKCYENICYAVDRSSHQIEKDKLFHYEEDYRIAEIIFEKYLVNSESLYVDLESLVCNFLHIFDRKVIASHPKFDQGEVFKGVKLRSEYSQQQVLEYAKGYSSR
jgi:hypothetical protein